MHMLVNLLGDQELASYLTWIILISMLKYFQACKHYAISIVSEPSGFVAKCFITFQTPHPLLLKDWHFHVDAKQS